jgi:hypothetical protein
VRHIPYRFRGGAEGDVKLKWCGATRNGKRRRDEDCQECLRIDVLVRLGCLVPYDCDSWRHGVEHGRHSCQQCGGKGFILKEGLPP